MRAEPLPIVAAIRERHSVRNFLGPLSPEGQSVVTQALTESLSLRRPFGTNVDVADHPPGLGRLGIISNEAGWLLAKVPTDVTDTSRSFVDLGFILHEAVIRLAQRGIATVVNGAFNTGVAERSTPGFKVVLAVAYGEDAGHPGLVSRLFSWVSGSRTRFPFDRLFFNGERGVPFHEDECAGLLEIVRLGPSALNKQPWRLVIIGEAVHVFNAGSQSFTWFDIGIALSGIHLFAVTNGSEGQLEFAAVGDPPACPLGGTYVITATVPALRRAPQ
jgi:hypothetical protein